MNEPLNQPINQPLNQPLHTSATQSSENPAGYDMGSIERAVAGDYVFNISQINREAWSVSKDHKWLVHLTVSLYAVFYLLVLCGAKFSVYTLLGLDPLASISREIEPYNSDILIASLLENGLFILFSAPVSAGLSLMAIRLSVSTPTPATFIFGFFNKMLPLFFTYLLMYVMILIGFMLLILPGIYLSVAYLMALPLVVEKNLSPWQALETSRKAISKRWFSLFGWCLLMTLLAIAASIPLFLGWIWFLPMAFIAYGIIYRNMFGIESSTLDS